MRVVLRFLSDHATLATAPVVLVGESYGGFRASLMLNLLLHPDQYAGNPFGDAELMARIRDHFGVAAGSALTVAQVAAQFGRAVLIQPGVTSKQFEIANAMAADPSSPWSRLGDQLLNRDFYKYDSDKDWFSRTVGPAFYATVEDPTLLGQVLSFDVTSVAGFALANRKDAFRDLSELPANVFWVQDQLDESRFRQTFGAIAGWDRYFVPLGSGFAWQEFGPQFLQDLVDVRFFITQAALDLVVYSPSIPPALAAFTDLVDRVDSDQAARDGVDRPGWITVHYHAGAFGVPADTVSIIRWPVYASAGHMVAASQPVELSADVEAWLSE
jgi:hypothetical protein